MTHPGNAPMPSPLLDAVLNLSRFHREHEKFYASAPENKPSFSNDTHVPCMRWPTGGQARDPPPPRH